MDTAESLPVPPYTLRSIYLRNSTTRLTAGFDPTIPGQPLAGVFRTHDGQVECRETEIEQDGQRSLVRSCAFTTAFEFAYTRPLETGLPQSDDDIEKTLVAQITAEITVDYLFNHDQFHDQAALQKWGASNVLVHAWPYWRELCHNTLLRMNLPVTIMPMMQIAQHAPE